MTIHIEKDQPLAMRLYRTPYFVLPRLAIEAMPVAWQERLEALLAEADEAGLVTPNYHVIRNDNGFTSTRRDDPTDEYSSIRVYYVHAFDPWANYRRGRVDDLCPTFKAAPEPEWIEWSGGVCPVPSDTKVEVALSNTVKIEASAGAFGWHHVGGAGDIVAYRVVA